MALNLTDIMNKVTKAVTVIAAGVAVLHATDLEGADKKKTLMTALNSLEGEFKIDIPDPIMSIVIEVLLAVGKLKGVFGNSAADSQAQPST